MIEVTELAESLARETATDTGQMIALVSGYAHTLSDRPALYHEHTGRLTNAGARVVAYHVQHLNATGTLRYQLALTQDPDHQRV